MKILYIVSSLRRSGPIVVLQNIIRNLSIPPENIFIIKLCADEPQRSITNEFIKDNINIIEFNFTKLSLEILTSKCTKIVEDKIKIINPDIIHVHGYQPALIASKITLRIPKTITLHNIPQEDFISSKGRLMGRYMISRFLKALRKFDSAVAISEKVKERHYEKIGSNLPIELIYNGISLPEPSNIEIASIIRQYDISPEDRVFIVVGSLTERKDPLCIIRAFQKAFQTTKSVKLLFLGKGPLWDTCVEEIGNDSRIILVGWVPDVSNFLKMSSFSISASHSEGFGLNFIESLSVGTPIISSDIPVFDEFKKLYPILTDFTFLCGNSDSLAEKMIRAYNTKELNIGEIVTDVNSRFSGKTMGDQYLLHYNALISKNNKP